MEQYMAEQMDKTAEELKVRPYTVIKWTSTTLAVVHTPDYTNGLEDGALVRTGRVDKFGELRRVCDMLNDSHEKAYNTLPANAIQLSDDVLEKLDFLIADARAYTESHPLMQILKTAMPKEMQDKLGMNRAMDSAFDRGAFVSDLVKHMHNMVQSKKDGASML